MLNVGNPAEESPTAGAREGLLASLDRGTPLLAVHSSATTFVGWDDWETILGGRWVRGTTFHPPQGVGSVRPRDDAIMPAAGLEPFEVDDELYTLLRTDPAVTVVAEHELDGVDHPLAWTHVIGTARVAYDALGHDAASYAAPGRRELLRREIEWLLSSS